MFHHPISVLVLGGPYDGGRVVVPAEHLGEDIVVCLNEEIYKFIWFMGQPIFIHKETE